MLLVEERRHVAEWNTLKAELEERLADIEEEFVEEGIPVSECSRREMWRLVEHVYKVLDIREPRPALFGKDDGTFSVVYQKRGTRKRISFEFDATGRFYRIWTVRPPSRVEGPIAVVADPIGVSDLVRAFVTSVSARAV